MFWVVDNVSSHRGQRAVDRMAQRWPKARFVQLPVHASWLNQVEIYFSVVQRKVLTPDDFAELAKVESRLAAFERRYEQIARLTQGTGWRSVVATGGARQPGCRAFGQGAAGDQEHPL